MIRGDVLEAVRHARHLLHACSCTVPQSIDTYSPETLKLLCPCAPVFQNPPQRHVDRDMPVTLIVRSVGCQALGDLMP